ncbi:hypothetical protein AGDE_09591 [Angomonas deanei]|nr:hypothetical protein AGDE_09591 [Angomonas deanei]|eukprot:EPY30143.1 hypothetical protein AGDE_09591 [Angomonas deanei]
MNSLYSAAPLPSTDDDDWFDEAANDVGDVYDHAGEETETSDDDDAALDPTVIQEKLEKRIELCSDMLQRVRELSERNSEFDEKNDRKCKISGIGKLKSKIQRESDNSERYLNELETAESTNEPESVVNGIVSKAVLLIRCSSLTHLGYILHCAEREEDVTGVCVIVPASTDASRKTPSLEVDVVSGGGHRWIKIRTSSSRSLDQELRDGERSSFVQLVQAIARSAKQTKLAFQRHPELTLLFTSEPPARLKGLIESVDVTVARLTADGKTVPPLPTLRATPKFVCFDTTALVALCSQTCFCEESTVALFYERLRAFKVLTAQMQFERTDHAVEEHIDQHIRQFTTFMKKEAMGEWLLDLERGLHDESMSEAERRNRLAYAPVSLIQPDLSWLDTLQKEWEVYPNGDITFFESEAVVEVDETRTKKEESVGEVPNWIIADITYHEFKWMIETLAGPFEVRRAARLLRNIAIVNTDFLRKPPSSVSTQAEHTLLTHAQTLKVTSKVSLRNKIVFGMADVLHAVVVTSNRQVQNAAREQQFHFYAANHPTRSLTEQKLKCLPRRPGPPKPPPFDYDG